MRSLFLLTFLSFSLLASCQQSGSERTPQKNSNAEGINQVLSPVAFKAKMAELGEGRQLIDVRTPEEFEEGHIEGAVNLNFFDNDFAQQLGQQLDKDRPVMLYCRSGNRSGKASKIMESLGYREIYDLEGGYLDWSK